MSNPRFLQIHTLHSYSAALINRDDSGLSKRLPYGGVMRTRISSQCLKRHWRIADDPHALIRIDGATGDFRSRELVTIKVIDPLRERFDEKNIALLESALQKAVYGDKGDSKKSRQTLLLGEPELRWLADQAEILATEHRETEDLKAAIKEWEKSFRQNIKTMRENTMLPNGLSSALFGRMVTSDPSANIDAPVHVAHAFTVHEEETESDYFTAVDDLKPDDSDSGADTIQESELTSGLYYGYVVVDIEALVKNCRGDRALSGKILHNLVYLIAEVSPGAKLGSTAPYGRADFMLLESGDRQPRSLAAAFREPVKPLLSDALSAMERHTQRLDELYATGESRVYLSFLDKPFATANFGNLETLAGWAAKTTGGEV
ncbi:MAG: type I-E CRISPR-associated protein Cas7/Cse4/CasC [Magnetococcales bacterium]|nr:type I-E CRISPR-associated protein Cas7/Cse4/CasC [Magnetococcales bacterium]